MDIQNIILIVLCFFDLFLGILIIKRRPNDEKNISYSLFVLWIISWTIGIAMFRYLNNLNGLLFWNRFFILAAALIGSGLLHFSFVFPYTTIKLTFLKRFFIYFPNIFILWAVLTPNVLIKNIVVRPWGNESILGDGYLYYGIYFSVISIWAIINLLKKYIKSLGIIKFQLLYVILGLLISLIFGATFDLIFILLGNYRLIWLGPYASFIMLIFIGYGIIKHRLMDIRIVVRQVTVYGVSLIISIGLSLLLMLFALNYLSFYISSPWIGSLILIFGIIVFQLVKERFSKFANHHLFFTLYSYEKTLGDLTEKLSRSIDLNRLVSLTTETIKDVMKLDKISLLLHKLSPPKGEIKLLNNNHHSQNNHDLIKEDKKEADFYLAQNNAFEEKYFDGLMKNKILIQYLESSKKPLVKDEIEHLIEEFDNEEDKNIFRKLEESMETIKAHIYLPLIIENHLIGFFILGKKVSGDAYTIQDLNLLETVANQIAIAINNAQLYEQSQYFNQILRVRVAEATQELSGAYRELKKLDDSKTEFLSLASHQLRTPLSAIKGYLSMVMEGNFGKLEKETEGAIKDVYQSNERLIALVNDLLNITRIEAGKLEYHPKETDFEKLVASVIKELDMTAKNKGLELKEKISKLPLINIDPDKIRQVLINLIDNALKYTEKGKVTVQAKKVDDHILVEIKDTGIGMSADKMTTLFQWFSRGKGALRLDAGGFGLGLYIAKKIVEKANGKIWAESKGEKKGSTFVFELPIK